MTIDVTAIRDALARFQPRRIDDETLRPSAVLLPLFTQGGELHLLFTLRTDDVRHHKGEISFPGGAVDEGDSDLLHTALRETEEEIGITPGDVTIIGELDDFVSVHGYRVSPYVGSIPVPLELRINPAETAEVILLPLSLLSETARWREENWLHRGRPLPVPFCETGNHTIWGLTAEILRQFLRRIEII